MAYRRGALGANIAGFHTAILEVSSKNLRKAGIRPRRQRPTVGAFARFLSNQGAQISAAKNAFEGLRLVREIQPDVVLSDLKMPGRSGFELLADIQDFSRSLGRTIPVIAMTAHRYKLADMAAAGFHLHLEKPFMPDQLLATLDRALHK